MNGWIDGQITQPAFSGITLSNIFLGTRGNKSFNLFFSSILTCEGSPVKIQINNTCTISDIQVPVEMQDICLYTHVYTLHVVFTMAMLSPRQHCHCDNTITLLVSDVSIIGSVVGISPSLLVLVSVLQYWYQSVIISISISPLLLQYWYQSVIFSISIRPF